MNIVLFSHPAFMSSQSMPRFARMLQEAYLALGHRVQVWSPQARVYNWVPRGRLTKWAGYVDQYLIFPLWVRKQIKQQPADTLYVFCDQALGPWVPLVKDRPHVVHVHDLLALRSALGDVPENPTSPTGRIYQRYIRHGFQQARHFISISKKTRDDLHHFGKIKPVTSEVVYNGLNYPFAPMPTDDALQVLTRAGLPASAAGMLLHVSGGQWYKNLPGVIQLYAQYAKAEPNPLPLWCISPTPSPAVQKILNDLPAQAKVLFFQGLDNQALVAAYSLARVFMVPSLAEGFGWPIIEAQACGCPVMTTNAAPMNEIGGPAVHYLPLLHKEDDVHAWATAGANTLKNLLNLTPSQRQQLTAQGQNHAAQFSADGAITSYLNIYQQVLAASVSSKAFTHPAPRGQNIT